MLLQWLVISFQVAWAQNQPLVSYAPSNDDYQSFPVVHVLSKYFTGPANKDAGNPECVIGFIAYYCFGQQTKFSDYNTEEHVTNTVLEHIWIQKTTTWAQYLSCCPPHSKTNDGEYYRCNSWTTEDNDNCHTLNLPWNDGKIAAVGAMVPNCAKCPGGKAPPVGGNEQWMYSFPAEGEGTTWWQGLARRVEMSALAWYWVRQAGGCDSGWHDCRGKEIEDPCYGKCINKYLTTLDLIGHTHDVMEDITNYPNYGVPGDDVQGLAYGGDDSKLKCIDLSSGNSAYGTPIDLWDCNGLVNQAWYWKYGEDMIELAGHNLPGMCIDVPGGQAENGAKLWLWGCNGGDSQLWTYDNDANTIHYKADENYCIDLPAGDTTNGNQLWLWECNGEDSQVWNILQGGNAKDDLRVHRPVSNTSRNVTHKPKGGRSWMHEMKGWLGSAGSNITMPSDFVPWYERKGIRDWYAAQAPAPGSGLPRPLVPKGWNGYNRTTTVTSKALDVEKFSVLV